MTIMQDREDDQRTWIIRGAVLTLDGCMPAVVSCWLYCDVCADHNGHVETSFTGHVWAENSDVTSRAIGRRGLLEFQKKRLSIRVINIDGAIRSTGEIAEGFPVFNT